MVQPSDQTLFVIFALCTAALSIPVGYLVAAEVLTLVTGRWKRKLDRPRSQD
jgi:hypothetical protein